MSEGVVLVNKAFIARFEAVEKKVLGGVRGSGVSNTPHGVLFMPQPTPRRPQIRYLPEVVRMRVTGAILEGTPAIAVCKAFDGTDVGPTEYAVALAGPHVANSELYACQPAGGVIYNPTYLTEPVLWQEIARLPEGEIQHQLYGNVVQNGTGWELPLGLPDLNEVET